MLKQSVLLIAILLGASFPYQVKSFSFLTPAQHVRRIGHRFAPVATNFNRRCVSSDLQNIPESSRKISSFDFKFKRATATCLALIVSVMVLKPVFASDFVSSAFTESLSGSTFMESLNQQAADSGFVQAFLLIFLSELGDKTFFIAGLLAAKYGKLISFAGSMGALATMTVISVLLGQLFHAVPDSLTQGFPFDDVIAVVAFTYFGLKTLYDASQLKVDDNSGIEEEKEEAEKTVAELSDDNKRQSALGLVLQTFSLVFAAEIGDRSFLSTIALSAALNPIAVAAGAISAHAAATSIAVVGGVLLSKYLSEKVIGYIGGSLFVVFAITTALGIF